MKKYNYKCGASIEIRDSEDWDIPVVTCMGETHVGDLTYRKEFVATNKNGDSVVCTKWEDAKKFIYS